MQPKLNRRRALFVLDKVDEILSWERHAEQEKDTRFVELGRYLCEVRAGQYWRLENLGSATDGDGPMNDFQPRRPRLRLDQDPYRKLRTEVLERDGWRCQYCGSSEHLEVHHLCSRS